MQISGHINWFGCQVLQLNQALQSWDPEKLKQLQHHWREQASAPNELKTVQKNSITGQFTCLDRNSSVSCMNALLRSFLSTPICKRSGYRVLSLQNWEGVKVQGPDFHMNNHLAERKSKGQWIFLFFSLLHNRGSIWCYISQFFGKKIWAEEKGKQFNSRK